MNRLNVRKTWKLYIDGEFPRTESGRFYPVSSSKGELLANACRGSRKDLRNAIVAARKAQPGWASRTAFNRGQILYRIAEVLESRAGELEEELRRTGVGKSEARGEVEKSIDLWVYYAGWSDKFSQVLGSVNPVAGPYYNFTLPEPTGVVGVLAPELPSLLGLTARIAPALVGGNTVVAVVSESRPLPGITMGEIFATSDVPAGVVNLISGFRKELLSWLAAHMDVNALDLSAVTGDELREAEIAAAENVKRTIRGQAAQEGSLAAIADYLEMKTVWHPVGV